MRSDGHVNRRIDSRFSQTLNFLTRIGAIVGLFWSGGYLINLLTHRENIGSR